MPPRRAAAGAAATANMVRHCAAGSTTLATSAARIPTQMESWLALPRDPRSAGGATSEMYSGTTADARPMPKPETRRPATMALRDVAAAQRSAPAASGTQLAIRAPRRPSVSDTAPPETLPSVAPTSTLDTTRPALTASEAKPRSAAMAWRGPLTTPRWYPKAKPPMHATATLSMAVP